MNHPYRMRTTMPGGLALRAMLAIFAAPPAAQMGPAAVAVEPSAVAALDQMGAYLRTLSQTR